MIYAEIEDCLGNQLFTYASTKTIALDRKMPYRYRVVKPGYVVTEDGKDAYGHQWIADFEKHLSIDESERVFARPTEIRNEWREPWPRKTNFQKQAREVSEYTCMRGHLCAPRYFEHRRSEVLEWFKFSGALRERASERASMIRRELGKDVLVSIHVRFGKDYIQQGKALDPRYYIEAMRKTLAAVGPRAGVVLFSDDLESTRRWFEGIPIFIERGSPFEDLSVMTECDHHVVGNSSFGWWGAWLRRKAGEQLVTRPSVFPVGNGEFYPIDIFPDDWLVLPASRYSTDRKWVDKILEMFGK